MSKIIIDTKDVDEVIQLYGCGDLTRHVFDEVIKRGKELVYCEDCDMSYPCISPFDRKDYVRCTYGHCGDGKVERRHHYCSAGERRKDNACER